VALPATRLKSEHHAGAGAPRHQNSGSNRRKQEGDVLVRDLHLRYGSASMIASSSARS
jgi:hypothetical protein